jgi:hypothetical protein
MEDADQPTMSISSRLSHDNLKKEEQGGPGDQHTGHRQILHCSSSSSVGQLVQIAETDCHFKIDFEVLF